MTNGGLAVNLGAQMAAVAARSPVLLGDAAARVAAFARDTATVDGGFRGRSKKSDLYYAAFASGILLALGEPVPAAMGSWLDGFGDGDSLDFVHLVCLVRCHVNLRGAVPPGRRQGLTTKLHRFAAADGGWHPDPGAPTGSLYGAFLGVGAAQDLGMSIDVDALLASLEGCRAATGGYGNLPGQEVGITTLSAGAVVLRTACGVPAVAEDLTWLRARQHDLGGFHPSPAMPMPDLLSTATALHALAVAGGGIDDGLRNRSLRFLDAVWDEGSAGFCGHALDRTVDVEYTWYGLLCAGHLAVSASGGGHEDHEGMKITKAEQ